jgi:hypothetical protein
MDLNESQESKKERLRLHLNFLQTLLVQKSNYLLTIASISAALLVVATFSKELVPFNNKVKLSLIFLLITIPSSLFIFLLEIFFAERNTEKAIREVTGLDKLISRNTFLQKYIYPVFVIFPFIAVTVLMIVVIYFIYSISLVVAV